MQEYMMDLALKRAGFSTLSDFLADRGISESSAETALMPYLVGYDLWRIQKGDTYTNIASRFGTTVRAIETANPNRDPERLQIGQLLVVPLGFSVVPEDTPVTSELLRYVIRGLEARYPQLGDRIIGRTEYGRPIYQMAVGSGVRTVYYNASHHANEWITTPLVLSLMERLLKAQAFGERLEGVDIRELLREVRLYLVPMVNPDGVDLVTGATNETETAAARAISEDYPQIPFPEGWKANLRGVDLNLNYPARWDEAKEIKYSQGVTSPAPRDFVGPEPLSEKESKALFDTTETLNPQVVIAWHTQGEEIYWKFLDLEPQGARALGEEMAAASGYKLEEIPYASSFAGYKDWFIQDFDRPGYTIESGYGENPLPLSQLPEMIRDNLPIFLLGLTGPLGRWETAAPAQQPIQPVQTPQQVQAPQQPTRQNRGQGGWG